MLLFRKPLFNLFTSKKYYTSYYTRTINKFKCPEESYFKLYTSLNTYEEIHETNVQITLMDDIGFGTSLSKIKSKLKNSFRLVKELKNIEILFTEVKILNFKFIMEMHFYKQRLVFFRYVFRNQVGKTELKKLLQNKYFEENIKSEDIFNRCIKDKNNNYVFFIDEVNLSINYMTYQFGFYDYILELKMEKELKELLNHERAVTEFSDRL